MKIINVFDTREYVQGPDDKWYPIPGSGDLNICDRCGKGHEVHYHIETEGNQKVVGGGCAKKDGLITETQHKSLGSASITLAKNKAELNYLINQKKIQDEIWNRVEKLEVPEIIEGEFQNCEFSFGGRINKEAFFKMGDVEVKIFNAEYTKEYLKELGSNGSGSLEYNNKFQIQNGKENLLRDWKLKRFYELAPKGFKQVSKYDIEKIEFQVKRAEKKIKKLLEGNI